MKAEHDGSHGVHLTEVFSDSSIAQEISIYFYSPPDANKDCRAAIDEGHPSYPSFTVV